MLVMTSHKTQQQDSTYLAQNSEQLKVQNAVTCPGNNHQLLYVVLEEK